MKCDLYNSKILLIMLFSSLFSMCCISDIIAETKNKIEVKSMFIIKNYNNMKIRDPRCDSLVNAETTEEYYINTTCSICYYEDLTNQDIPHRAKIVIHIDQYLRSANVKNELLLKILSDIKGDLSTVNYSYNKQNILNSKSKLTNDYYYYILSNDKIITIHAFETEAPLELIKDYIAKYPPTINISLADFDINRIFQIENQKRLEMISNLDRLRRGITSSPTDRYNAVINQCTIELNIRCQFDSSNSNQPVDCTTTFIEDNSKRQKGYDNLKNEISNRKIVVGNIDWRTLGSVACKMSQENISKRTIKVLHISEADIFKAPY